MLTENIRSAKRGKNERNGIHNWHPYYASYSEYFVEDMLDYLGANESSIVLDPWMGSGTTALVCQKRGIKSFGIDINPVMVIFSKAKTRNLIELNLDSIGNAIKETASHVKLAEDEFLNNEDTLEFVSDKHLNVLNKIQLAIDDVCKHHSDISDAPLSETIRAFYFAVLFRCLRYVGKFKIGKNPTWLVNEIRKARTDEVDTYHLFYHYVKAMIKDLETYYTNILNCDYSYPSLYEGDSKKMIFPDCTADNIITSPPYLTRIDYAVSTKPELLFLGYKQDTDFDRVRRATMGAPVIADKNIDINEKWGSCICSFLKQVKEHHAKASQSYYLPIFLQYFRDAFESLHEIKRVLKPNGKACLVVQSSYYKDVEAKLGEMYVEMAQSLNLEAQIIKRDVVKHHLANVNTKSSKYVKNKIYYEDAVLIRKKGKN